MLSPEQMLGVYWLDLWETLLHQLQHVDEILQMCWRSLKKCAFEDLTWVISWCATFTLFDQRWGATWSPSINCAHMLQDTFCWRVEVMLSHLSRFIPSGWHFFLLLWHLFSLVWNLYLWCSLCCLEHHFCDRTPLVYLLNHSDEQTSFAFMCEVKSPNLQLETRLKSLCYTPKLKH